MPTADELRLLQALPLELKVEKTKARIREFVEHYGIDNVIVSFSGGKDSTVLLHLARTVYPEISAVYCNTGLEYPEIQSFVRKQENVQVIRPEMRFDEVIKTYGYPFVSKEVAQVVYQARRGSEQALRRLNGGGEKSMYSYPKYKQLLDVDFEISHLCCNEMKKKPLHKLKKASILGTMTEESRLRKTAWLRTGCNAFANNKSSPMSFWTSQDVLQYIKDNGIEIASVYGEVVNNNKGKLECSGCKRTGCIYCAFGAQSDTINNGDPRFLMLKRTHRKQYDYCMGGGEYDENGIWKPNKDGLGMAHCIDVLNKLYYKKYKNFIDY